MLGIAEFYKSTPKIMPKSAQMKKRVPSPPASPASKKPRIDAEQVKRRLENGSIKLEKELEPQRCSARLISLKSLGINKKEVKIKQEVKEEEEEEEEVLPSNQSSDDDDGDDSDAGNGELSAYERRRLQNIQQNAEFFASLGISKTKDTLSDLAQKKTQKPISRGLKSEKREKKKPEPLPRRPPSLRIRRLDPDGVALPEIPVPAFIDDTPSHPRKPSGPIDMKPTNASDDSGENLPSHLFKSVTKASKSLEPGKATAHPDDLAAFTETLESMTLTEERVAKVVKDRVFSAAVHPSPSKIIVAAGDKWGRVGVWDVESREGDDGVYLFEPHSRPVNCLQFAPADPAKLYSCSYDGTVRCGDFETGKFDEIHTTDVDDNIHCSHFDFLSPDGAKLLVAQNQQEGYVQVVDSRLRCHSASAGFWLHNRYIKTVHVHPTKPEYFVTASNDSTVALWDLRSLKEHGRCKSVSSVPHFRSVSAAYFSPLTGNKIVTTAYDDKIRIVQVEENSNLELERAIRHDNHVGRWLTSFRAVWHPRREDVIVVGSMERPRRIHVFSDQGKLLCNLKNSELLGSVCSINAFHPTRDMVVGANASGRLHVFM